MPDLRQMHPPTCQRPPLTPPKKHFEAPAMLTFSRTVSWGLCQLSRSSSIFTDGIPMVFGKVEYGWDRVGYVCKRWKKMNQQENKYLWEEISHYAADASPTTKQRRLSKAASLKFTLYSGWCRWQGSATGMQKKARSTTIATESSRDDVGSCQKSWRTGYLKFKGYAYMYLD